MAKDKRINPEDKKAKDQPISKPDPETLNTTDPQDNMRGPLSSLANEVREEMEEHGGEEPEGDNKPVKDKKN